MIQIPIESMNLMMLNVAMPRIMLIGTGRK